MTVPDITIDRSLIQTEAEMLARWGGYDKPLVSINCITFNHEKYIRDALDGFLIQKTDFPLEILIHDDASTDKTADIIREYEKRYPSIIKPIYQTVNQYSQGKKCSLFNFERAKGEYSAVCEGDDCWFDSLKLQRQIQAMVDYSDCEISFHSAVAKFEDGPRKNRKVSEHSDRQKIFSIEKVIDCGGSFMPTASIIVRNKCLDKIFDFFDKYNPPVGDSVIQILGALSGGALFLPHCMVVYRMRVPGSWSDLNNNIKSKINHNKSVNEYYKNILKVYSEYSKIIYRKMFYNNILLGRYLLRKMQVIDGLYCLLYSCKCLYLSLIK
ncbi:glycosyltransferase [Desulfogranum mediterraneum]|uniref:glycosyltransferase n=1 Tax=Desulfogranum mediterraneum TaxID=160661 RepID=UPI0003FC3D4B|nr:glycosyltransferase [Desulfogranum mediterraneum]